MSVDRVPDAQASFKVLVIDDDNGVVEALVLGFQDSLPQIRIIAAHQGERGMALVAAEAPDLVLLDPASPTSAVSRS